MFDAFEHYIIVFDFVKHVEAINCFVDFLKYVCIRKTNVIGAMQSLMNSGERKARSLTRRRILL